MGNKIFCKVCNQQTNYTINTFCRYHLKRVHNIDSKKYYDLYFKLLDEEGFCKTCDKPTKFKNINEGYANYCSGRCTLKNKEIKSKITEIRKNNDLKKYGCWYQQTSKYKEKSYITKIKKYGDVNYCNKEKIKETCLKKYGVDNYSKSIDFRKIMENKKLFIPLDEKKDFEIYRMLVFNETRKWVDELFNNWNGRDFYNGEKLITEAKNFNSPKYRTIDHKISIYHGFINGILPTIIGHIDNLCICSRSNNSKKRHKSLIGGYKKWVQETEVVLENVLNG